MEIRQTQGRQREASGAAHARTTDRRGTAGRHGTGPISSVRLEERDLVLLCDLFTHGAMLRSQIQALFFPSLRRCNRRLQQLGLAGYVAASALPLGPQTALTPGLASGADGYGGQRVYRAVMGAAPYVALRLGWSEPDVRRLLRPATPTYLAHTLEIVQFRIALEAAARGALDVRLARFLPERLVRHSYEVREAGRAQARWRAEVFKPDAFFQLESTTGKALDTFSCFVEIDLGHTSAREFAAKLRIHDRYRESGLFARRYGGRDCHTLVCTTNPVRRDHLRALAEQEGARQCRLATFSDLAREGMLSPVWHAPGEPAPTSLLKAVTT